MEFDQVFNQDQPVFVISVAARIVGVQTQTLRHYERIGLIEPSRTPGNQRVFSTKDIERIRQIRTLVEDMGVNLAGVEVILKLFDRIGNAEARTERLQAENNRLVEALENRN